MALAGASSRRAERWVSVLPARRGSAHRVQPQMAFSPLPVAQEHEAWLALLAQCAALIEHADAVLSQLWAVAQAERR